jgi:hypothetical protein
MLKKGRKRTKMEVGFQLADTMDGIHHALTRKTLIGEGVAG